MQQSESLAGAEQRALPRIVRAVLALSCLVIGSVGAAGACSGSTEQPAKGEQCVGGVIVDGVCEGKCDKALCKPGNTCVGNRCVLQCDSHQDCYQGVQDCTAAVEDDTNAPIFVCKANGKAAGVGVSCPFGTECAAFGSCPDGSACSLAQCNNAPGDCTRDAEACGDDPSCAIGKCPDGSGCAVPTCSVDECTPLSCLSSGPGDPYAYCTVSDCNADDECPAGYQCGLTRDPHEICGSNPTKGNNSFCGTVPDGEPCVDPSTFGQGNTYVEGPICLMHKMCIKRTQCLPCSTDLDCSLVSGQKCVPVGGENHCARTCASDRDCDNNYQCDMSAQACVPKFGKCTGAGNFCEPCQNDLDCSGPTGSSACLGTLSGELACIEINPRTPCDTDADCPASPAPGVRGRCITSAHLCDFPVNLDLEKQSCW